MVVAVGDALTACRVVTAEGDGSPMFGSGSSSLQPREEQGQQHTESIQRRRIKGGPSRDENLGAESTAGSGERVFRPCTSGG